MKRAPAWDFPFAGSWWRSMAAGFGSKARRERAAPSALACHFLHRKELVEGQLQYGKGPVARCFYPKGQTGTKMTVHLCRPQQEFLEVFALYGPDYIKAVGVAQPFAAQGLGLGCFRCRGHTPWFDVQNRSAVHRIQSAYPNLIPLYFLQSYSRHANAVGAAGTA